VNAAPTDVFNVDPLISLRGDTAAIADLAFGSLSRGNSSLAGRPLEFLTAETLELDLGDPAQRQFGDYELLELIGEGGMGVVYRARQESLDREVAVKLLAAGPWASREFVERFRREAQNAARMQHPNIVAIYEVGSAEELHFFSMRLIAGSSLAAVIRRDGILPAMRAASLLRTIAEAVDYAHRLGVLHLDLKPANVLIDENGTPHVADFGLARRMEQGLAADNDEVSGTPSYMAPEQATAGAQKITPATDIWGLGAILYELVTGQPPFLGDSPQATLRMMLEHSVRAPSEIVAQTPRDLEAIILKCMQREVALRYPNSRALADDLGRFIENRPVRARPLNRTQRVWRWARRQPYIAALGLLFTLSLLTGLIATTMQWRRADANATHAEINARRAEANAAQSSERLWAGRRDAALRLMQDGKGFQALTPLLANIEEQEHAGKSDAASVERREFGMIQSQGVTLIDRMILPDAPPLAAGLSPDGSLLAIGLGDLSVRWYDTATLTERGRVDVAGLPTSDGEERAPRLLRFVDNHRLRVTLDWFDYLASPSNNNTYLVDLDQAKVIEAPEQFADLAEANFSADGHRAHLLNRRSEVQLWQVEPWKPLSALRLEHRTGVWEEFLGRNGRFVATEEEDVAGFLRLRDARDLSVSKPVALQGAVTAWAENSTGSLLATGDSGGRLYLIDTATRALRQLPTPSGREVTWVAFSEDDAWLAAARWDGAAFAFDVASGSPLNSGQMQNEFEPHEVAINRSERLLAVSGLGETAVWRLPTTAPNAMEATRLLASPTRALRAGTNATAICLPARLLVTASQDGEVRLWRLPPPPALPASPALRGDLNLATANLQFDGEHVPDVAYDALRVAATSAAPSTSWITLPSPVGFSELVDTGKTLVATSGHSLHVFDVTATDLRARFAAVDLPANPLRLAASADGRLAALAFGTNSVAGFEETIIVHELASGATLGQVRVHGPLRQFELAPDGTRLLIVGPAAGTTEVFDTAALQRIGTYRHNAARPVTWASFVAQAQSLWLLTRDADDATANDADLILWNPGTGASGERRHLAGSFPIGVTTLSGKPFVATRERDLLDAGGPGEISSAPLPQHAEATAVFAHSHDGRLLAHVFGRDVQLYDTATLAPVGPPLSSATHNMMFPLRLAFSPNDDYLLGDGWLLWPVSADVRPLGELRAVVQLLDPASSSEHVMQLPSPKQRRQLRRADPGAPLRMVSRPQFPAARLVGGLPIPARDAAATPMQLDLTAFYNRRGDLLGEMSSSIPGAVGRVFGLARIDGVDYDMRGCIELRTNGSGSFTRAVGIRVPPVPVAALHVLLMASLATSVPDVQEYANVRLHYMDGSSVLLPIQTQRDVPGMSDHDLPTPIGWVRGDFLRLVGLSRQELTSNPRLPNPHPEKLIATIDLETSTTRLSVPVFFAITAEPVIATTDSGIETMPRDVSARTR
jgi:WD40 repeat protein